MLPALLTSLQHRTTEANYRLIISGEVHGMDKLLEPWRLYEQDQRHAMLVSTVAALPSTSASPLEKADINGVISWHTSCMMMTANIRLFEQAAGRSGSTEVPAALQHIAHWASMPTARRAVLHAAQVFKLLFYRRVSDVINVHTVAALFKSALILSFYLLTAPVSNNPGLKRTLELFDEIDWSQVGKRGMADVASSELGSGDGDHSSASSATLFIEEGGSFSITGVVHPPGHSSCRRVLLHAADLMQTLGKWKSRTFSHILYLLTDDLMDIDAADDEE